MILRARRDCDSPGEATELFRLHVLHPISRPASLPVLGWDGFQLPVFDDLAVEEKLEPNDDDVVPDGEGQVELGDDEVEEGGDDGAPEVPGEDVGEGVAETAGEDVTNNIDLAVSPVLLARSGGLPEQVDHKVRVLAHLPQQPGEHGEQEAQARLQVTEEDDDEAQSSVGDVGDGVGIQGVLRGLQTVVFRDIERPQGSTVVAGQFVCRGDEAQQDGGLDQPQQYDGQVGEVRQAVLLCLQPYYGPGAITGEWREWNQQTHLNYCELPRGLVPTNGCVELPALRSAEVNDKFD